MFKLFKHQELALSYLRLFNNFALFMEQGCGKTLPCLCRILELRKQGKIKNALVVAPKAAMGAWSRDTELFEKADADIINSTITVVNYEMFWRRTFLDKRWYRSPKYNPTIKGEYDKQWDFIVLDESHKIKDRTSLQARMAHHLAFNAKYKVILTGTPIGNGSLQDIWSQFTFLEPYKEKRSVCSTIFGGTYYNFLDKYAFLNQWYQPYKFKNVRELQKIIGQHSYRVEKKDCLDLPEKLPDEIYEIELLERAKYRELHYQSTIESMEIIAENSLVRQINMREICSGFITDEKRQIIPMKCEKLTVLEDFLDGWNKKLVIFAQFTYSIDKICDLLTRLKIKSVRLDGTQKNKQIWKDFQNDESIRVIVCQYESANMGIDLYAADTILYYEPTIVSRTLEQSRDRIHRTGQTQKCSYIHFITTGTVEQYIYKALKGYKDFDERLFKEYIEEYQKGISYKKKL